MPSRDCACHRLRCIAGRALISPVSLGLDQKVPCSFPQIIGMHPALERCVSAPSECITVSYNPSIRNRDPVRRDFLMEVSRNSLLRPILDRPLFSRGNVALYDEAHNEADRGRAGSRADKNLPDILHVERGGRPVVLDRAHIPWAPAHEHPLDSRHGYSEIGAKLPLGGILRYHIRGAGFAQRPFGLLQRQYNEQERQGGKSAAYARDPVARISERVSVFRDLRGFFSSDIRAPLGAQIGLCAIWIAITAAVTYLRAAGLVAGRRYSSAVFGAGRALFLCLIWWTSSS